MGGFPGIRTALETEGARCLCPDMSGLLRGGPPAEVGHAAARAGKSGHPAVSRCPDLAFSQSALRNIYNKIKGLIAKRSAQTWPNPCPDMSGLFQHTPIDCRRALAFLLQLSNLHKLFQIATRLPGGNLWRILVTKILQRNRLAARQS